MENSIQNELEHLYKWDAGHKVSQEAIKAFGVDKIFVSIDISNEIFSRISGKSYKDNCTIPLEDLCYLKLLHYDLNLDIRIGEVICNKSIASDLINVFKDLYKLKYPIEKILLIDEYNADDEASMQDNNSSAFNFRQIVGGGKLSKHATGVAIDITISGTITNVPDGVENITVTAKPVKMIQNGQLIIKKGDAQFNAQGATVK